MLAGVTNSHLKDLLGPEDPLSRWLTHMAGEIVVAVGRKAQFLAMWAPPLGLLENLSGMVAGFPQSK